MTGKVAAPVSTPELAIFPEGNTMKGRWLWNSTEDPNPGMGTETPGIDERNFAHKCSRRFRLRRSGRKSGDVVVHDPVAVVRVINEIYPDRGEVDAAGKQLRQFAGSSGSDGLY